MNRWKHFVSAARQLETTSDWNEAETRRNYNLDHRRAIEHTQYPRLCQQHHQFWRAHIKNGKFWATSTMLNFIDVVVLKIEIIFQMVLWIRAKWW